MKEYQIVTTEGIKTFTLKKPLDTKEKLLIVKAILDIACREEIDDEYVQISKTFGQFLFNYYIIKKQTTLFDDIEGDEDFTLEDIIKVLDKIGYLNQKEVLNICNRELGIVEELAKYLNYEYEEKNEIRKLENSSFSRILNMFKNIIGEKDFFETIKNIYDKEKIINDK